MNKFSMLVICVLLSMPYSIQAHHGIANFDLNKDVAISGVINDIAFINPHSWLYVNVLDENGNQVEWKCELRGSTVLRRSGWSKEMFQIGQQVNVTGSPDRFEENTCYMGSITFEDGTQMNRYGQLSKTEPLVIPQSIKRMPSGVPDFSGDWAPEQNVMTDPRGISGAFLPISIASEFDPGEVPQGGRAFPGARGTPESFSETPIDTAWSARQSPVQLTDAGQVAIAGFDPSSTDNPRLRCESTNILFDWTFEQTPNNINQQEDVIYITYGMMGLERVIHLDMEAFPAMLTPSRAGFSIGRWNGDVLEVQTRGFLSGILSADASIPHSEELVITETFFLEQEGRALVRTYVAEDSLYFEGRYQGRDTVYPSEIPWEEFNCDDRSFRSDL